MLPGTANFIAIVGVWLVLCEAETAWLQSMFTPAQVIARWGQRGIAFVTHGGMWGDLLVLPFLCRFLIDKLGGGWSRQDVMYAAAIGFAITLGNHINLCLNQKMPDPLGWQKQWFSMTILLHFIYMWGVVTVVALVYLFSPGVAVSTVVLMSVILGVHTFFGIHIALGILNRFAKWEWCPEFLTHQAIIMQVGIWTGLAGFSWRAAGLSAGAVVAIVGTALVLATMVVATETPSPEHTTN